MERSGGGVTMDIEPPRIPNDQSISVVLTAERWDLVLRMLAQGPYHVVAPVISDIQRQCMMATAPPMRVQHEANTDREMN